MSAEKKCVVITGAAGALGSSVASVLAKKHGFCVALLDVPAAKERLEKLAADLGANARAYAIDIRDAAAWSKAMPAIEKDLAPASHAVLVAGGWRGGKALHEQTDDDEWNAMIEMNLDTMHRSLRALLPGMVLRKHGSIVVIGARAADRPDTSARSAAYGTSKAAVVALARAVASEVLESGVRVNAILPSTMDTPANRRAMPNADPSRWVATDSAAAVIAFLLSEDARDVSGAAIPVYGRS
jgi:NAD(P)-dependent dehydrogenase (short-subunit alcohol dehydrogenase family)